VPKLREALAALGREDIVIVLGDVVPLQDYEVLYEAGTGAVIPEVASRILEELAQRLGRGPLA